MKFCPVDRCVNPDDALRCRNCGHVFKKPKMQKSRSRAVLEPEAPVRRLGSPRPACPLLLLLDAEGRTLETFRLQGEPTVLGRSEGLVTFPGDARLSASHASVRGDGVQAFLRDLKSRHGTFLRAEQVEVFDGLETLLGETLLRWSAPSSGGGWKVTASRGDAAASTSEFSGAFTIGRKGQDLELDDPTVSPLHAKLKGTTLVDARSLNGLYFRLPAGRNEVMEAGSQFRIGGQLFRVELPAKGEPRG